MLIKNKNRYSFTPDTLCKEDDTQLQEEATVLKEMESNSDDSTLEVINNYFDLLEEESDIENSHNNRSIRNEDYSQRYCRQISSIKNTLILSTVFALTNSVDFIPNIKLFPF